MLLLLFLAAPTVPEEDSPPDKKSPVDDVVGPNPAQDNPESDSDRRRPRQAGGPGSLSPGKQNSGDGEPAGESPAGRPSDGKKHRDGDPDGQTPHEKGYSPRQIHDVDAEPGDLDRRNDQKSDVKRLSDDTPSDDLARDPQTEGKGSGDSKPRATNSDPQNADDRGSGDTKAQGKPFEDRKPQNERPPAGDHRADEEPADRSGNEDRDREMPNGDDKPADAEAPGRPTQDDQPAPAPAEPAPRWDRSYEGQFIIDGGGRPWRNFDRIIHPFPGPLPAPIGRASPPPPVPRAPRHIPMWRILADLWRDRKSYLIALVACAAGVWAALWRIGLVIEALS
jgi:hypothetical protein